MAQVTITIPTALVPRVKAAIRGKWGARIYPSPDGKYQTNPLTNLTDIQAFQFVIAEYIKAQVIDWETSQAVETAQAAVETAKTTVVADMGGIV